MESEDYNKTVKLQYSFSGFLWRKLTTISDLQAMNQHYDALKRTLDLINFLPKDVQTKFQPEAKKIRKEIEKIRKNNIGVDSFTAMVDDVNALDAYAEENLNPFLSELILFLDKKDYLEIGGINPLRPSKRRMGLPK